MGTIRLRTEDIQKEQALAWASSFETYCFLNYKNLSLEYANYQPFPCILAVGAQQQIESATGKCFEKLKIFQAQSIGPIFGYLGYDIKNEIEILQSNNSGYHKFPDMFFFLPEHIIEFKENEILLTSSNPEETFTLIQKYIREEKTPFPSFPIQQRTTKEQYIRSVEKIKQHLLDGNIYELNYCIEFYAENSSIHPEELFKALIENYPMPFSVLLKTKDKFLISASPERFLKKQGDKLISQPMKGTSRRSIDREEDEQLKGTLKYSEKEQSENMMIVDLVRNDLAKSSKPGSTKVEELFSVYSLSNVHQMISTVCSEIKNNIHFIDAIKNAFPMGSMTGAPKIRAMQLIDELESTKRGLYSGAFGYITPNGDFDFNVVIRSILYNSSLKYISFQAGSAITFDSEPEKEYEECLLKASTLANLLK